MAGPEIPSPDKITAEEFAALVGRYPSCAEAISESKGAKAGQKTLVELDEYRYNKATEAFGPSQPNAIMTLDEVRLLVEWKLRHGTFRPTLMKLVSSNEPKRVKDTIQKAIKLYRDKSDVSAALGILTQLKGIGPATASLLLAVYDPDDVIFFADEAFYWLCLGGKKGPIKYNTKEYAQLNEKAKMLCGRLGVKAVDVERAAFVLMKEGPWPGSADQGSERKTKTELENQVGGEEKATARTKTKRKAEDPMDETKAAPPRRSKRGKRS